MKNYFFSKARITVAFFILIGHFAQSAGATIEPNNTGNITCTHFWERHGNLVPSGKVVGEDVGEPPGADFDHVGTYQCKVRLRYADARSGQFLFIGEVGDASYLELNRVNGNPVKRLPITHGLDPSLEDAKYARYIPFVISTHDLFVEDGVHEFTIRYKDIVPHQVGIRSGAPSLESLTGILKRALKCSPAFTFHVIQIIFFFLLAASFLAWPKLSNGKRFLYAFASLAAAWVILQVSAIPRSFLSPIWSMRLNDFSQIISFPILACSLLTFFPPKTKKATYCLILLHFLLSIMAIGILLSVEHSDQEYMMIFGLALLALGGIPCFLLGQAVLRKWVHFTGGPIFPRGLGYIYIMLGSLYAFDIFNLVFLGSRYYYFNHFLFFSTILWSMWRMQSHVSPNEVKLRNDLDSQNRQAYKAIAGSLPANVDSLILFTEELASLFGSDRISIQEVTDGMLRFVGHFGDYVNIPGLHEILPESLVAKAIETRKIQYGRFFSKKYINRKTDVVVVPLENESRVIGVLSATDFCDGILPHFFADRMEIIKQECEPVLSLLIAERHNRSKDSLIQMIRNRTHPLQLRSEEYFLKNFDVSTSLQSHAFIYGDLVGSVSLNERYSDAKNNPIESAIDEHLAFLWEKFKHLGVVVSRTKGDMISIIVPSQVSDQSEKEAVERCFEILSYLSIASPDLQRIGRKYQISLELQYRFAMSIVRRPLVINKNDRSLRSFNLLVDEAIDTAARIIGGIALDGECLVMEPAKELLSDTARLLELDVQRVKGKSISVRLWTLNSDTIQKIA